MLRGDHCLALQGGDLNHITVHRRFDTGIGKIDLGGIQAGLIFGDLRSGGFNLRFFYRQLSGEFIQILARHRLHLGQFAVTLQGHCRQLLLCQSLLQLGLQLLQRGFAFANAVLCLFGIDNAEQLAFLHLIANLDLQALQLSADLSPHINLTHRIQLAGCQYALLQIAFSDLDGLKLHRSRMAKMPISHNGKHHQNGTHQQSAFLTFE
ncbi:hypothetical protein D3C73_704460 [compost metagenome]